MDDQSSVADLLVLSDPYAFTLFTFLLASTGTAIVVGGRVEKIVGAVLLVLQALVILANGPKVSCDVMLACDVFVLIILVIIALRGGPGWVVFAAGWQVNSTLNTFHRIVLQERYDEYLFRTCNNLWFYLLLGSLFWGALEARRRHLAQPQRSGRQEGFSLNPNLLGLGRLA